MLDTNAWGPGRYLSLVAVLALHAAFFAAILAWPPALRGSAAAAAPVEIVFLPPNRPVPVRWDNPRPHRVSASLPSSIAPPSLDPNSAATPAARSNGSGSAVDWRAEARRALQAFEIRTNRRANGDPTLGMSAEDNWAQLQHHAGDRYKTESGDWIVWINSSCYQVASSTSTTYAVGGPLPQTVCPDAGAAPPVRR